MIQQKRTSRKIGFAVLVVLGLLGCGSKRHNWAENYKADNKGPYGTSIFFELLKDKEGGSKFSVTESKLHKVLPDSAIASNYVFIGEALFLDSVDVECLINFVDRGNVAFISSRTIPNNLITRIQFDPCQVGYWEDYFEIYDTAVAMRLDHPSLLPERTFKARYFKRRTYQSYRWQYIAQDFLCDTLGGLVSIGTFDDGLVNMAMIEYGQGTFVLHTTPLAFSNIQLLDKEGAEYAMLAASHLRPGGHIYWEEYGKVMENVGRMRNDRDSGYNRNLASESPLRYILSQPALRWAWYLFLAAGLLYILFRAKRKQKIIPVLDGKPNTSFEFISTVGRMYFLNNDHKKLCALKMKFLQHFLKQRFLLQIKNWDEQEIEKIIKKTEVGETLIRDIAGTWHQINGFKVVENPLLVKFHILIDQFYQNCR